MEYYTRLAMDPNWEDDFHQQPEVPDSEYLKRMQRLLGAYPNVGVPPSVTGIAPFVFLGTTADAENVDRIKSMRIKYILNCAGSGNSRRFQRYRDLYTPETGVMGYQELLIADSEYASARPYFERAHSFIDHAVAHQSKVLIFCPGVSRAGVIALSYLIRRGTTLLMATKELKDKRRVVLTNDKFMSDLVTYARDMHLLDPEIDLIKAPRFGRKLDMYRLRRSHIPISLQ